MPVLPGRPATERVVIERPWIVGGRGRLRDAFPLPPLVFLSAKALLWSFLHPVRPVLVLLFAYLWIRYTLVSAVTIYLLGGTFKSAVGLGWSMRGCNPSYFRTTSYSTVIRQVARNVLRKHILRLRWGQCCVAGNLLDKRNGRPVPIRRVRINPNGLSFLALTGKSGHTVDELRQASFTISAVLRATSVVAEEQMPGLALVFLAWGDPTVRELTLADLPGSPQGTAAFGRDQEGDPALIGLDTSTLVVGESGSGKSNLVWALLAGLNQNKAPYRLRVVDPAGGVELALLEDAAMTKYYANTAKGSEDVIKQMREAMYQRLASMRKRGLRKHIPTESEPRDILIIDELLLMSEMLKDGAKSPLGEILSVGRKAGYIIWGLSQLSQVDALGRVRDLFPQRICLATKSREMTDAVLGPGAEASGALCSKISRTTPGVGYLFINGLRGFRKFRAAFVPDNHAVIIAQGEFPAPDDPELVANSESPDLMRRKTALYRLYNADGRLLYIGITANVNTRFADHKAEKAWWPEVDVSASRIYWYANRRLALKAETAAIRNEHPVFNVDGAPVGEAHGLGSDHDPLSHEPGSADPPADGRE